MIWRLSCLAYGFLRDLEKSYSFLIGASNTLHLPALQLGSFYEFQTLEVFFAPAGLDFNYFLKRLQGKRITEGVRSHRHSPAIGVPIALVGSSLTDEVKTVARSRGDEFSRGERTKAPIVDGHVLDGNRDTGFFLRYLGDLDVTRSAFGERRSFLREFFDDHANDFVDVLERFVPGAP